MVSVADYTKRDEATSSLNYSFNRRYRLTRPGEFTRVFNKARRSSDRFFTVLHRSNDGDSARIGFAVAKKKIPAAAGRNRVRRIARESFRVNRTALPCDDIIILAQSAAAAARNKDLFASLDKHWQRLRDSAKQE